MNGVSCFILIRVLCQLFADNLTCLCGTTVKVCVRPIARPMNTVDGAASSAVSISMYDALSYIYIGRIYIYIYGTRGGAVG